MRVFVLAAALLVLAGCTGKGPSWASRFSSVDPEIIDRVEFYTLSDGEGNYEVTAMLEEGYDISTPWTPQEVSRIKRATSRYTRRKCYQPDIFHSELGNTGYYFQFRCL